MPLSLIRSAVIYLLSTLIVCLLLGLTLMFARSVTLDSVRAIDLQLIYRAIEGFDLKNTEDYVRSEKILNALVSPTGYALFPLAILTPEGCVENNRTPLLCQTFPKGMAFRTKLETGRISEYFGSKILKTDKSVYYYYQALDEQNTWLIGKSGHYAGDQKPFHQEITFLLKDAPILLTTAYGFKTMLRKSKWTWLFCMVFGVLAWVLYAARIIRAERLINENKNKTHLVDRQLVEQQQKIFELRLDRDSRQEEYYALQEEYQNASSEKQEKQNKIREIENDLTTAEEMLEDQEREKTKLLKYQKELYEELTTTKKKLSSTDRKSDAALISKQLFNLKKLWLTDPDWLEREEIEADIVASDLDRAPFTDFIAFVHMEHYLKKACDYKGIWDVDGNSERINALRKKGLISEKDKAMLHEARKARNSWFHEVSPPHKKLMKKLLKFLNSRKNPDIPPHI